MTTMQARQVTEPVAEHGEGAVWDGRSGTLRSVDLSRGDLLETLDDGTVRRRHYGKVLTAFRPRAGGGFVIAVERGFRLLDADLEVEVDFIPAFDDAGIRMNDGGCDPQGRFHCGTMAYDEREGAGTLYRLDPDRSVHTVLTGVTISNGVQWSADGTTAFYHDTPTHRVDRYRFDAETGEFRGREEFARLTDDEGAPDGMAIDAEGGIWSVCWGGGAVRRFAPDGALSALVEVPAPNPTSCAFGGADGKTLYITSSRLNGGDRVAASGAVFAVETGVTGGVVHSFAG